MMAFGLEEILAVLFASFALWQYLTKSHERDLGYWQMSAGCSAFCLVCGLILLKTLP
jgi:hypothetical protein